MMDVEIFHSFIGILILLLLVGLCSFLVFMRVQELEVKILKQKCSTILRDIDAINNDIRIRAKIHNFIKEELI